MKKLLAFSLLATLAATGAEARDSLSIGIGVNSPGYYEPAPVYAAPVVVYQPVAVRPVYRPYYPVGYRDGRWRHREYDYGYWERHDNGRHNGWDKH